jgi:hypothetical protein
VRRCSEELEEARASVLVEFEAQRQRIVVQLKKQRVRRLSTRRREDLT